VGVFNYKDIYCEMKQLIRHILREHTSEIGEGSPRVSFGEFLKRAKNVHGNKFKYDESSFNGMNNKMTMICPVHGPFQQTPKNHTLGQGCPKCGGVAKKTTEDFILEAKEIWKDKYDYSLTEYTGALNNIKIVYNGIVYEQRASSHLLGLAPEFRSNEESLLRDKVNQYDKEGINDIKEFLDKYQIEYEMNKNLDNNIFQFYLPNRRTIIEYLSKEHYLIKDIDKINQVLTWVDGDVTPKFVNIKPIQDMYALLDS
jgi:hypothetical protein